MDGSALLSMQELMVLGVAGWNIYFRLGASSSNGSGLAKLALTELHASIRLPGAVVAAVDGPHDSLLNAALRGGDRCSCACHRLSKSQKNVRERSWLHQIFTQEQSKQATLCCRKAESSGANRRWLHVSSHPSVMDSSHYVDSP